MTFSFESRREYVLAALDKHERYLTRYAARRLDGDLDVAADVVQFVFLKLCEQDQKKSESQLKAWLYTVCRNRIVDQFRKSGRLKTVDPAHFENLLSSANTQAGFEEMEQSLELKRRMDQFPVQDREIVDLWSHGLKHREIAEVIGKSPGAVRVQLYRLIRKLKEELGVTNTECELRKNN